MKPCSICKIVKPLEEFRTQTQTKDKHTSACRDCLKLSGKIQRDEFKKNPQYIDKITKICCICKIEKPIDNLSHDAASRDNYMAICRDCKNQYKKGFRANRKITGFPCKDRTEKICSKCKILKPIVFFTTSPTESDGRSTSCKECNAKKQH